MTKSKKSPTRIDVTKLNEAGEELRNTVKQLRAREHPDQTKAELEPASVEGWKELLAALETVTDHDGMISVGIFNTKLGAVTFTFSEEWTRANLATHFIQDHPDMLEWNGDSAIFSALTDEAMLELRKRLVQFVRNLTSEIWATAIGDVRNAHAKTKWRVKQLEDASNEEQPFWGTADKGRKPLSKSTRFKVLLEARRIRFEYKTRNEKLRKDQLLDELRTRLSEQEINYSEHRLDEIIYPRAPRKKRRVKKP